MKYIITFRTVFGGGPRTSEYLDALTDIKHQLESIDFTYELDLALFIGGTMLHVSEPTGMISPRISVPKKRVTARIRINDDDALNASDAGHLLRSTIYASVAELFERISTKDDSFDHKVALNKVQFLEK